MEALKIGDKVKWVSQSAGSSKEKTGTVHFIVPAGVNPARQRETINPRYRFKEMTDWSGMHRDHESYIILVESKSGRGKKMIYWPRVKNLQKL